MRENNFFAMVSRMKYINRWGLMRNTIDENIAEHSLIVSVIAHALAVIGNTYFDKNINAERVAVLALFHDTTEIITGDLPTPIKYFAPEIKKAYKDIEVFAGNKMLSAIPKQMQKEYESLLIPNDEEKKLWEYVKAADKISALIKCIEELEMGNMDFSKAKKSTEKAIEELELEEAKYFMDNFIQTYSLTVDEQSE
jgi:5'-deoxynucleotidase